MSKIGEVAIIIAVSQASSMQCWEMAVDTAGNQGDKDAFQADSDACEEHYDDALAYLEGACAGWRDEARRALEKAGDLEKDGGDNQHALRALAALDDLDDGEHLNQQP